MAQLTPEDWKRLRAEWELGAGFRELARKYEVSDAVIRRKSANPKDPWVRREGEIAAVESRAGALAAALHEMGIEPVEVVESVLAREVAPGGAQGVAGGVAGGGRSEEPRDARAREGAGEEAGSLYTSAERVNGDADLPDQTPSAPDPEAARLREEVASERVTVIAGSALEHLGRTNRLKKIFDRLAGHVEAALAPPEERSSEVLVDLAHMATDEKIELIRQTGVGGPVEMRRILALQILVPGTKDSLGGYLGQLAKLSDAIQQQERRALGLDVKPAGPGQGAGPGMPGDDAAQVASQAVAEIPIAFDEMSTEQLAQVAAAARILEGGTQRPPLPLPPAGPETGVPVGPEVIEEG